MLGLVSSILRLTSRPVTTMLAIMVRQGGQVLDRR